MFNAIAPYLSPPFRYEAEGQIIFDSNGTRVADVRGWGHLTGLGAHALAPAQAEEIQDRFGYDLAALLNESWPKRAASAPDAATGSGTSSSEQVQQIVAQYGKNLLITDH